MLVAFPSHQGDIALLNRLLRWIRALDGTLKNHDALLCFDAATPFDAAIEAQRLAEEIFREVRVFSTDKHYSGWPVACNHMWWSISKYVQEHWPQPWLLMEPDAVPLCQFWLVALEIEYRGLMKPFMGAIEDCQMPMMPPKVMSGVAVYPANCYERIPPMPGSVRPWNTDASSITVPSGAHTALIRDFFGTRERPPVFVESKTPTSPSHHFTLDWLPAEAVIFHRDKFHGLMPLLAKKLGIQWDHGELKTARKIVVLLPVHRGDIALALRHALWLRKLGRWSHRAIIAYDAIMPVGQVQQLKALLEPCFESVELFRYPAPPIPSYPASANWMFQSCAHYMAQQDAPWLLFEADACVLRADWLEQFQHGYERAGKSWMGSHVRGMSHANGTMIYPADAAHRMPRAMSCGAAEAFDMAAAADLMHDCHDCGDILFHTWSVLNGQWCPVGGGEVPVNISIDLARTIPKTAVMIHRVKGTSLTDLLLSGQYVH